MRFLTEHIGLAANEPEALKDWYVRVLEAKCLWNSGRTPPAFFLELSGGLRIEIYKGQSSVAETSVNSVGGWRHLALRVDSIESAKSELSARGVQFTEPLKPAGGGGSVLFFSDPEGNLLHLVERPADSLVKQAMDGK